MRVEDKLGAHAVLKLKAGRFVLSEAGLKVCGTSEILFRRVTRY